MSRNGHPGTAPPLLGHPVAAVFVGSFTMPNGVRFDTHTHQYHQLAWAERGLLRIGTRDGSWLLPPTLALWIPAGVPHTTEAAGDALMRAPYVNPVRCPEPVASWAEPTVLAATPLLRALIDHLGSPGLTLDARARAEAVLLDVLAPVPATSLSVAEPRDPRARAVASALAAAPDDRRPLAAWAAEVGVSARTLARLFAAETGLPFGRWREQLRMQSAVPLLAGGLTVEAVARRVGYASASSFVAAFHRVVGVTPRQYVSEPPRR
ncbi:AraC family transcriptional regulator [Streptomyces longispororuber]|uniref:HTH-type transcriptional regulator RipA n=1 Tax=Streptomyces longispororuber TaxID=68230 RepID=A0A919A496_9ACTN|nr:helix-turn-helix transcriptional regulator [Streptomyces longispororuber]GHE84696.1 AraC family transcriptional regulator [Streptomyces longispororuber]